MAVDSSTGETCPLVPEREWELWIFVEKGGELVLSEKRRPPGTGIFPPGFPGFGVSGMPRFSNLGFSIVDMLGLLGDAKAILALEFWPGLIPQLGLYQIRCVKTAQTDPWSAARELLGS